MLTSKEVICIGSALLYLYSIYVTVCSHQLRMKFSQPHSRLCVPVLEKCVLSVLFSRYERRMIEQDNKKERKERKKEEMARIRQLVGRYIFTLDKTI